MLSAAVQVLALALALLGVLGAAVATLLPNWKVSTAAWPSVVAPVWQMQGLWTDCVSFSSGAFSCTAKTSVLTLPPHLQATRAAMVLCCLLATLGLFLASLGLKCTRWGGSQREKGLTAVAAGGCFVLASFLCLVPASWFTSEVITAFLTTDLPDSSKYQPGGALCLTFISAGFLLAAGVIFCLSCPKKRSRRPDAAADRRQLHAEWKTNRSEEVQLQLEEVQPQKPPQEKANADQQQRHASPCRPPQKDIKDSYSLQEYV